MLACAGVVAALDAIYGPSTRRYIGPLFLGAVGIGGFIILKLTWTSTGSRAKQTTEGPSA